MEPTSPQQKPRIDGSAARTNIAIAVVLSLSVISTHTMLVSNYQPGIGPDDTRFDELRKVLPPRSTVGYISDLGGDDPAHSGAYYLTQYSMAAVLVSASPDHDLVIGNFTQPGAAAPFLKKHGLAVVRDFGRGVFLLRKPPADGASAAQILK